MNEQKIEELLASEGACLCGFADVRGFLPPDVPERLVYAVSFAYRLSQAVLETVTDRPSIMYFQHYRAVNARLDQMALDVVRLIENEGFSAFPIAASQSRPGAEYAGVFPHKTAAVKAGLGWIGKNGMLITGSFGPAVRLCTVLTDMPLNVCDTLCEDGCGDCLVCKNACPAGAITGNHFLPSGLRENVIDVRKCSEHMKTYKDIGRGAVCGLCFVRCPKIKKGQNT